MIKKTFLLLVTLILATLTVHSQVSKFGFDHVKIKSMDELMPFAVPNTEENRITLERENITIKYTTKNWIHINASADWVDQRANDKMLSDFYFEYAPPTTLDDSSRAIHFVNEVHGGEYPLPAGYTGKDVIIGVIDAGLDHDHPDFIDENGNKRLLRYWDHSITNPSNPPQPYNYGQVWTRNDIVNGTITSGEFEPSAHGSTVTGIATGNGLANGRHKGMAPDANIIVVKTNFNLSNWTLTIADACDYIFKVADSLGMPAVINISLGSYIGSHDATDPAGEYISQLVDNVPGKIVVCAAGNSGDGGKYHVHNDINQDTSFVWFLNNPNSNAALGANSVFFDLWTDTSEANFNYAIGVDNSQLPYQERATTIYRSTFASINNPIRDTLYNQSGQRLASMIIFTEIVGSNYHFQLYIDKVDSTDYYYRFSTTGEGSYDLWSGTFLRLNKIVEDVPSSVQFPPIVNYAKPDSLQTIVSSWNCSDKVISVGNLSTRYSHIDKNGNVYNTPDQTPPGTIFKTSSRGPTRLGVVKPDISATGQTTLASGPAWILNNPAWNGSLDEGGFHVRNGGTSMASPVVAGVGVMYLEKCGLSTAQDFKNDLIATRIQDQATGDTPNYTYGHGKLNAFETLVNTNKKIEFIGDTVLCQGAVSIGTNPPLLEYNWSTGETSSVITIDAVQTVYVHGVSEKGCTIFSDTIEIAHGESPPSPVITDYTDSLVSSEWDNYQWYFNDVAIQGAINQVIYPEQNGFYSVAIANEDGCVSFSNAIQYTLSLADYKLKLPEVYPNPVNAELQISFAGNTIDKVEIIDNLGRKIINHQVDSDKTSVNVEGLATGIYMVNIYTDNRMLPLKFVKK